MKKIHLVGIKGVGMTALAIILSEMGHKVTGSDTGESFITDQALSKLKLKIYPDFSSDHITENIDEVIYSGAYHPEKNEELKQAQVLSIPLHTQQEALAKITDDKKLIAVAGVGGKTTTTAMLSHILNSSGLKVGYFVGAGKINNQPKPGSWGENELFIAEADEYANNPDRDETPKLLLLSPEIVIIPNLAFDHPDIYSSKKETIFVFKKFLEKIPKEGKIYFNSDNALTKDLIKSLTNPSQAISVGFDQAASWQILKNSTKKQATLKHNNKTYQFTLKLIADYNFKNAALAAAVAFDQGIAWDRIQASLLEFSGVGRRQEFKGKAKGVLFYDDYAHHPVEISSTIEAFKNHFPQKKLWVIFEPHTYSRTQTLLPEFAESFNKADEILILPIFSSARENPQEFNLSHNTLIDKLTQKGLSAQALTYKQAPSYLAQNLEKNDLVLTLGAGTLYKLHPKIQKALAEK